MTLPTTAATPQLLDLRGSDKKPPANLANTVFVPALLRFSAFSCLFPHCKSLTL